MAAPEKRAPLSRRKKALFAVLAVLGPLLLLEAILNIAGVGFGWEVDAPLAHEQLKGYIGNSPLWSDEELLQANFSIYRDDRRLLWRLKPGLSKRIRNFLVPREFRDGRSFTVETDRMGFRLPGVEGGPGNPLVLCLGGSNTFGWGVEGTETWPVWLSAAFEDAGPRRFSVRNLGQPGYSSKQGRVLWEREGRRVAQGWVVLGFGFNDGLKAPLSDEKAVGMRSGVAGAVRHACSRIRIYRLLRRVLLSVRGSRTPDTADLGPRVPRPAFRVNMETLVTEVRKAGAEPVLLSVFCKYPEVLRELSEDLSVPLIDADRIAAALQAEFESGGGNSEARRRIESEVPAEFLSDDPGWWVRADAAHYNFLVHEGIAREVARIILASDSGEGAPKD